MVDYELSLHEQRGPNHWHLDRKVPIAFIIAIVVQTFMFGWIASSFNARVEGIETYIAESKIANAAAVVLERDRNDRLVRLETMIGEMHRTMLNIERKLEGPSTGGPRR